MWYKRAAEQIPPILTWSSPQRWGYAWETTTSELFCQAKTMREQSASTDFIKWPLGKDRNCPKSILATAGGLIFGQDLLKTQTQLEGCSQALPGQARLFPLQGTTTSLKHTKWPEGVGYTLTCPSALRECPGVLGGSVSLLAPEPGQVQSSATPQPGPLEMKVTKDGTGASPSCSFTLKQMREKSHHLLRGRGHCHTEQRRADWSGGTQNSCFSTTKPTGRHLPTPPSAKSVLTELSQMGPTCKKLRAALLLVL